MYLTENTPASFKSHNNVISSNYQQYSGEISEFPCKKRQRSRANTSKSHLFLLFWHTNFLIRSLNFYIGDVTKWWNLSSGSSTNGYNRKTQPELGPLAKTRHSILSNHAILSPPASCPSLLYIYPGKIVISWYLHNKVQCRI